MEVWKKVPSHQNYSVSNKGRVKRDKCVIEDKNGILLNYPEKIIKQELVRGYLRVSLSKKSVVKRFLVHRLVATCFITRNTNKNYVNHKDGLKVNNHESNLEWCTSSENEKHSYKTLGKINHIRKLSDSQVLDIRANCIKGINKQFRGNVSDYAEKYNVNRKTIYSVLDNIYYVTA
jgi:hypothetical protein